MICENFFSYELFLSESTSFSKRGAALYINKKLKSEEIKFKEKFEESVWAQIKLNNNDMLLLGCIYKSSMFLFNLLYGFSIQRNIVVFLSFVAGFCIHMWYIFVFCLIELGQTERWNYFKGDYTNMNTFLQCDWNDILKGKYAEQQFDIIMTKFNEASVLGSHFSLILVFSMTCWSR
jgi:hypothetical protein